MEKEKTYTGENEKWFLFNEKITIYRDDGKPYMERRTLVSFGKWFSIKYHKVLESDDVCSHDHPWPFITIILKGGYEEWTPFYLTDSGEYMDTQMGVNGVEENCHYHKPGSIMYRPVEWVHRLQLREDARTGKLIHAHSLVFTGKVVQDWGFFTRSGWIFWENYSKQKYC